MAIKMVCLCMCMNCCAYFCIGELLWWRSEIYWSRERYRDIWQECTTVWTSAVSTVLKDWWTGQRFIYREICPWKWPVWCTVLPASACLCSVGRHWYSGSFSKGKMLIFFLPIVLLLRHWILLYLTVEQLGRCRFSVAAPRVWNSFIWGTQNWLRLSAHF